MPIAIATHVFRQPLRAALQAARSVGADAVQLDARAEVRPEDLSATGRRQLLHHLEELRLSIASLRFPTRRTFCDQTELDARLAAARKTLEFAYQLGAKTVVARAGRVPDDTQSLEYALLRDVLNDLARHSNRVGAVFALTPAGEAPQALAELLAAVTDGPVGVNFDPAVYVLGGRDPVDAFRTLHAHVLHVTVRDAVRDADGSGLEVPVGRGEVPWDELLAVLYEAAYRGPLTVDRTAGENPAGDAARAIEFLRHALPR
jgi:sugar phosphate isomerase/epimerase